MFPPLKLRHIFTHNICNDVPMKCNIVCFSTDSFGQAAVMGHFIILALLWVTRDLGGEYGWGHLFKKS